MIENETRMTLRLPAGIANELKSNAKHRMRSLNAEILCLLQNQLSEEAEDPIVTSKIVRQIIQEQLNPLELRIKVLEQSS